MKILLCAILSAALAAIAAAADKPNIVYIYLDDAGYGDFSCFGQEKFTTPNIDRLAEEGMRLTDHYSGSTVCAPSRSSLMTGYHTGHCSVRGNKEVQPEGQSPIPEDSVTIAKLLKAAGYSTGAFGKWGLGAPGSVGEPTRQGFDRFYGYNCQREAHNFYPTHLWSDTEKVPLDGKTYSHDLILDEMLNFIRGNKDKPFFCFAPVTIPHAAMHVPEEDAKPFREKFPQFENVVGTYKGPDVTNPVAAFAGMMTRLDRGIGQVSALLKELGLDQKTIILITSDNGPHKEGGHKPDFFNSNGGFRGYKRDLYEGGIRVPFIVRWPGKVKAGSESDLVCAHWDMLPTFCELAGAATPKGIDGISIVPTLLGKSADQTKRDYLYWEFHERGQAQAVRMGKWKGIRNGLAKNPDAPLEIYDLSNDPHETNDVVETNSDIAKKLLSAMTESHVESETFPFFTKKKKGKKNRK